MTTSIHHRIVGIVIAIAMIALLLGMWVQHNGRHKENLPPELINATLLPQPRPLAPFQLIDGHQQLFTNKNLQGQWTLIFFGFTRCPMLCPTTLSTLNQTYQKLTAANQQPMPQVVFISVDPEEDSPEKIQQFLAKFNSHFEGATGDEQQLTALTQQLNIMYSKIRRNNAENYSIDHSGTILLIDPRGDFYAAFSMPHDPDNIAKDFATIVRYYR